MEALNGPIACHALIHGKSAVYSAPLASYSSENIRCLESKIWGSNFKCKRIIKVKSQFPQPCTKKNQPIQCGSSFSSDGNDSMAGNYNLDDEDYVPCSVIEAVEVRNAPDGFEIKMRDGRYLRCVHNNPQVGGFIEHCGHPAMVLKMEDGSDLLLPIIVLEMPSNFLMATIKNIQIARPTVYQLVKDLTEKMGYTVQLIRITKRVNAAYFAELHLTKVGNDEEPICLDIRPSDGINIAVRCKASVQVNKYLVHCDGVRVVEPPTPTASKSGAQGILFTELDRPDGHPCFEAKEFDLVRNMLTAATEERYRDAGIMILIGGMSTILLEESSSCFQQRAQFQ